MAAIMVMLNSRMGCILSLVHAFFTAIGYNMHALKDLFFTFVVWYYSGNTPKVRKSSPCVPRNEFKESMLNVDKSKAFGDEFFN